MAYLMMKMYLLSDFNSKNNDQYQKYSRLRCLLRVKGLVICFYLGWSGSILQFRQNIIKVGSKSWLLTCSSNITLSLPSYTGSALKRELNFCNGYLSLLYFWCQRKHKTIPPSEIKELHCNKVPLILQEGREKSHDCKFQFLLLHDNIQGLLFTGKIIEPVFYA